MGKFPSLIAYPLFRLTVSMATGIFLFDRFLDGQVTLWPLYGLFLVLLVGMILDFRSHSYGWRWGFGLLTSASFLVFGGIRVMQEKQSVDFNWSKERNVYWGRVMTSPVEKGKTLQAEVRVEGMFLSRDSLSSASSLSDSSSLSASASSSSLAVSLSDASSLLYKGRNIVPIDRSILLYWMPDSTQRRLACGNVVVFEAKIARPFSEEDLTGFDYGAYLLRKGISGTAIAFKGDWTGLKVMRNLSIKQQALKCRDWMVNRYRSWHLGDEEFAVVAALTIGDKRVLTSELKEIYSAAGVSHVLALSGLHIGILSAILFFLFAPLTRMRGGKTLRSLLVVGILWGFAFVSGLSPSVVRAVTMCSLYVGAACVSEERFSGMHALTLAAFLMLVYQPLYLFDLSFQLSFMAVFSILFFYPLISQMWSVKNRWLRPVWNVISVSLSAQLGTLPLILYCFGTFPTYFLLANLIVSVLAVCIFCGALAALMLSSLPWIGEWAVSFLNGSTWALNTSMKWVEQLDGAQLTSLSISATQALWGFLFLIGLYCFWIHHRARYVVLMLFAFNLTLLEWVYAVSSPAATAVYFSRGGLYLKQHRQVEPLVSSNGLYRVGELKIGVLNTAYWKDKSSDKKVKLDYIYLCRGFQGSIQSLLHVFDVHQVILDTSLSERYREFLIKECMKLKIPYKDVSRQGSYRIFL